MPKYDWKCSSCGAANEAGIETCALCESPAVISGWELDAHREGASSVREYVFVLVRRAAKNPYNLDFAKTLALFALSVGGLRLGAYLEIKVFWWLLLPLLIYSVIFFGRVWWRTMRHILTGEAYERV